MKRSTLAVGFVLIVWALWGRPSTTLKLFGGLGPEIETALQFHRIDFKKQGGLVLIETDRPEKLIDVLARLLADEQKRLDVISNNLANSQTTKTANGLPFRRQVVECGPDGFIREVAEDQSDFNWVYDPSHPDAMKEGPKRGYLAKPNVNLLQERADFAAHQRTSEVLRRALHQLDPELIICLPDRSQEEPPAQAVNLQALTSKVSTVAPPSVSNEHYWQNVTGGMGGLLVSQSNGTASGQACVAMAVNRLTGSALDDRDIDRIYAFQLLKALKQECRSSGFDWRDGGDINSRSRETLTPLLDKGWPVILALNGPLDPSGHNRGHIVLLESTSGEKVTYLDPWDATRKTTTWTVLCQAPPHPDGNFLFVPERVSEGGPPPLRTARTLEGAL